MTRKIRAERIRVTPELASFLRMKKIELGLKGVSYLKPEDLKKKKKGKKLFGDLYEEDFKLKW